MNAARRKEIEKASGLLAEAKSILEQAAAEEREYYDNMPEAIQAGEKGDAADNAATALESAVDSVDEAVSYAEEAVSYAEEAGSA